MSELHIILLTSYSSAREHTHTHTHNNERPIRTVLTPYSPAKKQKYHVHIS
jgi:LEA14-like dessication related protein